MKYFGLSGAFALSAVLLSGCCGGNRACSVPEELLVARDSVCAEDSSADVSIVFDAPLDKSLPLSAAVGEYFSEVLGGSYQDDSRDFKAAAQYYFDARLESSREFFREYIEESGMEGGAGCYDKIEFVKDSESPLYLTYRFSEYSYSGGRARQHHISRRDFPQVRRPQDRLGRSRAGCVFGGTAVPDL